MQHGILARQNPSEQRNNNNGDANVANLQQLYARHTARREAIRSSKHLIKLLLELQKHRGCTLAILSGDHFFATQLHSIQREITELFRSIQKNAKSAVQQEDLSNLLKEWVVLRQHWPKDDPHENFLHHSNLIARLLTFIWQSCGERLVQDLDNAQQQLARFFFKEWLDMIETCAQARGLATHSAVIGTLSDEITSRIRFLNTQMEQLDKGLQTLLPTLQNHHQNALLKRMDNTEYAEHLQAFMATTSEGLNRGKLDDADSLYRLGSQCVSACQQVLWCALHLLDHCLPQELDAWVSGQHGAAKHVIYAKPSSTILPIAVPASNS
ncbi:MAG: hypothetical protein R3183_10325 [Oleiphilaceae bacterium]|nr:hypothetical protein [Oleiphilaceae bacterium]